MNENTYTDKDLVVVTQLAYLTIINPIAETNSTVQEIFGGFSRGDDSAMNQFNNFLYERKLSADSEGVGQSRYQAAYNLFCELSDPNSKYADWKIIDIKSLNDLSIDGSNGFYAVMIETGEGQAMVGFRGSESFETWQTEEDWFIADVGLLNSTETKV